jgi:ABC-2 type transport system permease protein
LTATPATASSPERESPAATNASKDRDVSTGSVFGALLRRDLRVARRELPYFLVRTLMQPVLFIIVFGFLLPKMGFVRGGYTTALLPGIIAVSLALSAVQAVALPMVQDFGWTREIEDRLLAPVPTELIASEKIVAGALQGIISALVVLPIARVIMGPIQGLSIEHIVPFIGITALSAMTFSSLGLLMGTAIAPQQIGFMFSIIIAPMLMFGCAYYPWRGLDRVPVMKYAVLVNPLVYVAEGMRGAITPEVPHMPIVASASALVLLAGGFWFWGRRTFLRKALG